MTINEAIEHCLEKGKNCSECGKEHLQLAQWLNELIALRQHNELLFGFIKNQINQFESKPLFKDGTHRLTVSGKVVQELKQSFIDKGYKF